MTIQVVQDERYQAAMEAVRTGGCLGLFADNDRTLAPGTDNPADSYPTVGAVETLHVLAGAGNLVVVSSGRPVTYLQTAYLHPVAGNTGGLILAGQYGLQFWRNSELFTLPAAEKWIPVLDSVRAAASRFFRDVPEVVEEKGDLTVAFHWRQRPDMESHIREFVHEQVTTHGLSAEAGKMVLELVPPIQVLDGKEWGKVNKGWVITEVLALNRETVEKQPKVVVVIGDDKGDHPAFEQARALDVPSLCVVVHSPELPPEIEELADVIVENPLEAAAFLDQLAAAAGLRVTHGPMANEMNWLKK